MKNTMTLKTVALLATLMLTQPLLATENNASENCLVPVGAKNMLIDAVKFTSVWLKLNKDDKAEKNTQKHLEAYIKDVLKDSNGTLDVEKFSAIWNNAGNNKTASDQSHLQNALVIIVDKASGHVCTHSK